jgi:uncharacterized protein (DUF697 family)
VIAVARSEDEDVATTVGTLLEAMDRVEAQWDVYPPAIVAVYRGEEGRAAGDFKTQQAFKDEFVRRGLSRDFVDVVSTARPGKLERVLLAHVGDEARFALARIFDDRSAKSEMALDLIRIASSLNATIATVPIPIGGFLPITTVQVCMIAGIAYVSGREVSGRTLAEFAAAMGINVGAGVALREIARAFIQWIPVAGSVVSASIAAGATFTLGKAAIRYYIDG